ncbi:tail fiber domain-containing protein [Burkholderia alba]|uniref:tail fiber domain-containing protein n=1 Tax=Burkholderia alba TaxID=2683677 RepID=UPI002B0604C1|nr:tail fiber domain-containing protein [Burkholderia alba]
MACGLPNIQADNTTKSINFANGANNAANMWVFDGGQVSVRSNLTVGGTTYAGGNNATIATDGNVWGPQWGGWLRAWLDAGLAHKVGDTLTGRYIFSGQGRQADLALHNWRQGQDAWVYLRARDGGGLDLVNSAYNAVPWQCSDVGETWQVNNAHVGTAVFQTDGNAWGAIWGNDYLSNWVARQVATRQITGNYINFGAGHTCNMGWVPASQRIDIGVDGGIVAYIASNTSDRNFKADIVPSVVDSLARIAGIDFVSYRYKERTLFSNGKIYDNGVIAQQVEEINPDWVENPSADYPDASKMLSLRPMLIDTMKAAHQLLERVGSLEKLLASK